MKLKNAGFESELDMMTALVGGEVVYFEKYDSTYEFWFNGGRLAVKGGENSCVTFSAGFAISMYSAAKVECKWYENITKPVPCWVRDDDDEERQIKLIHGYGGFANRCFSDSDSYPWENAIPLEPSDLLGGDDDSE